MAVTRRESSRMVDYNAPPNCYTFDKVKQEFGLSLGLSNTRTNRYQPMVKISLYFSVISLYKHTFFKLADIEY